MPGDTSDCFKRILQRYLPARNSQTFAQNPIREEFKAVCSKLSEIEAVRSCPSVHIEWSVGQGNWAKVPWIAFLDDRETKTTQHGIYGVFLFRQDMTGVYLTLAQGVTGLIKEKGKPQAHEILRQRASTVAARWCGPLQAKGFSTDDLIDLKADTGLGADYQASTIAYKFFPKEAFESPSLENILLEDISSILQAYKELIDSKSSTAKPSIGLSNYKIKSKFFEVCDSKVCGLNFKIQILNKFIASLAAKPFLVLTGLSGSGKTKLAQAFVRWITPDPDVTQQGESNPQYALIPVGADWTGNENILGYPDGLDASRYVTKPALEVILHAVANPDLPHFLILDEMNLSHVERYFADMLSAVESEEAIHLYKGAIRTMDGRQEVPQSVSLPGNLFIIGTVNVDETTYMFSPKVLDRANVIEFRMSADDLGAFLKGPAKPDLGKLDGLGASFGRTFVSAAKSPVTVPAEAASIFEEELLLLFKVLQSGGAEFGYRVAHEASRFLHFFKEFGDFPNGDDGWINEALDAVIVQKMLPKLHGSRGKLEGLLWALANVCGAERNGTHEDFLKVCEEATKCGDEARLSPDAVLSRIESATPPRQARYAESFAKVMRMYRKLQRDQFVSFAEA